MEKEAVYRGLKGHRAAAVAVQAGEVLAILTLVGAVQIGTGYIRLLAGQYALPYQMIFIACICLWDLLLISPLKARKYLFFRRCVTEELNNYHNLYKKALSLRLRLWGRRLVCVGSFCLLPAWLYALSFEGAAQLLRDVTAAAFLMCGCLLTEVYMLRYGPAWQLLPECATAREAMHKSRRLMRGHTGEYLWICWVRGGWGISCLMVLPALVAAPLMGVARAIWIQRQKESYE